MNYIKISKYDTANGIGIGVVLWVSGCNRHCFGCHNPQTWNFIAGQPFTENTMQELLKALDKSYISRLTFSGGHPLEPQNLETVYKIVKMVKEKFPNKSIWLYTGFLWEEICKEEIVRYLDVCVDGEFEVDKKELSLKWKGSSNQRVIDVKATKKSGEGVLHCA